ncbi:hypothetical protein YW3DRAFT_05821 [Streptomyces sp. MnatMP-M77]|nr:hypothetical protein YW3DRAFT_05821 [Streptomyces sp. MnatMP-M77]
MFGTRYIRSRGVVQQRVQARVNSLGNTVRVSLTYRVVLAAGVCLADATARSPNSYFSSLGVVVVAAAQQPSRTESLNRTGPWGASIQTQMSDEALSRSGPKPARCRAGRQERRGTEARRNASPYHVARTGGCGGKQGLQARAATRRLLQVVLAYGHPASAEPRTQLREKRRTYPRVQLPTKRSRLQARSAPAPPDSPPTCARPGGAAIHSQGRSDRAGPEVLRRAVCPAAGGQVTRRRRRSRDRAKTSACLPTS